MIQKILLFSLVIIILIASARVLLGQTQEKPKAMSNPESIDPLDPAAGDFLFQDQRELVRQAQSFYNEGDYRRAAAQYLYALQFNPGDNISIYNLACCYGLMNQPELATKYLRLALTSGFQNTELAKNDADFNNVRSNPEFKAVLDSIPRLTSLDSETQGRTLFFDACAIFQCRLHLPNNYDRTKTYPLVVGLHGYSDDANRFVENYSKFDDPGFIFAAPFAPYHFQLGNRIAYSWNLWIPGDIEFPGRDFNITEEYIINLINSLKKYYNIGDIYLMGHSQGGATTYITGIKHHEIFKGIIPIAGPFNPVWIGDESISEGNGLRVMIVHGKNDRSIFYREGVAARKILTEHEYNVDFIDYDGGHEYPPRDVFRKIQNWIESGK